MIAISVSVAISVTSTASFCSVQNHGHVFVFLLLIDFLQFGEHTPFEQPCAHHEDGPVGQRLDDLRVGYQLDGRAVYQHIFVLLPYGADHLLEPLVEQQLGGIGRYRPHGQYIHGLMLGAGYDDFVQVIDAAAQIVAQSLIGSVDIGGG